MNYLNLDITVQIHDFIIEKTGGAIGLRDKNLLESPLIAIQNDNYYPKIEDKVAFLMFSIIKNHPFIDGNKRSAVGVCSAFLMLNDYDKKDIDFFIFLAELVVVNVAMSKMTLEELRLFFKNWQELRKYRKRP